MDKYHHLYENYERYMSSVITEGLMSKEEFATFVSGALEEMNYEEVCGVNGLEAFAYYELDNDEINHCYIPAFGYYANSEKAMVKLFQRIAEKVMDDKPCEFSIRLYCEDIASINALHMMQFGNMSEKCIAKLETMNDLSCDSQISVLEKEEIKQQWNQIWKVTSQIIGHLKKSPIFYPASEFTEDVYKEFFLDVNTELIVAKDNDDNIVGMIEWNQERNHLLRKNCKSVNVGEAFVFPEYRGTGLAYTLLCYAQNRAIEDGANYMWVEHGTANPNARGFWNKYFKTYQYELVRKIG